jgi:hypothetical protein
MPDRRPIFESAFNSADDGANKQGIRPVIFDLVAPDLETSMLPDSLKMVLHVNPSTMKLAYQKIITRMQTKGGWVEQHWGDGVHDINFDLATGGFMRLYAGLSNITGGGIDVGGTRRETIAYDKYLDMLALFHNNGSIYDSRGNIAFQGQIKCTFDEGTYFGWFQNFNVNEAADAPYQFTLSTAFTVDHETHIFRTVQAKPNSLKDKQAPTRTFGNSPVIGSN